ncbi:carbohydrate ABC transporter ATP-binding protein, CUT1 family (TC 3.A.1.1.-) [Marinitoga hydrogenitolerans DSM 16785]|uniref:Carbohydrate ABC transporter ATP-binding protein, CUT1 family (TC 3.A.1.1.-) n=1 Tax=Marinitoga hydrogenitolerans (strain DSM 16785 / JCM 12826 / AT1271) TaxID=1122195 RepID=A0A1M4SJ23_MARH1|nr:ABC transporter ATP-binding protein [Marinitoga hydrogenitolerans]SHE31987.1 carbohydrate ABC transporter ATP-binding protein, CUT1 family (TC 3.A.1.1.-) [Marinitoga hydrogenitolerans DSM 16785]
MATIELKNLKKHFGNVKAVDDVSLKINDGEFVVFLGPSGCGKTTTLLMLAGIYKPTGGEILFDNQVVNEVPPKDREIGMVFQSYALYPHMTLYENIAFPLQAKKMDKNEIDKKVKDVTKNLDIGKLLDRKPNQISGGQQQRVAIARALVKKPKILLFDEPLSNLDAALRAYMRAEIKKLQHDLGITSVYVTHDQIEAMTMADRIAVFNKGKLMQFDIPDKIYNQPKNIFVARFVGTPSMNIIDVEIIKLGEDVYIKIEDDIKIKIVNKEIKEKINKISEKNVLMGLRPEDIKIRFKKEEGNSFKSKVYILEPLGREIIYNIKLGNNIFKIISDEKYELKIDDDIYLKFPDTNFHLFDKNTGENLLF